MMNKKMLIAVIAMVVLIGALLGVYFLAGPGKTVDSGATEGTDPAGSTITGCSFTVIVVHADGTEKSYTYTTDEEKLGVFLEAEGLIDDEGSNDGMFSIVDGEKAVWNDTTHSYWAFYVDGEYAVTGIYATPIVDGQVYKLEYTLG